MSKPDQLSAYLSELAGALDVLGPDEVNEIIREIFSDVKEAASENEVELSGALERLGPPKILAQRILEERGAFGAKPLVPEAPAWMRVLAGVIDGAVWLFGLSVFTVLGFVLTAAFFALVVDKLSGPMDGWLWPIGIPAVLVVILVAWTWFYFTPWGTSDPSVLGLAPWG